MDVTMTREDSEEVEIDLGDSDEFDNEEESHVLWKAPSDVEEGETIDTSALVEISDTKPLINVRDPRGVNDCLKVTFEDVIAEPPSVRSGDRVWIWSNALFEVSRIWIYRIVTVLLAIPLSVIFGLLFAFMSCLHIWMVGPSVQCIFTGTRWLQTLWSVVLDIIVRPFFSSAGRCCGGFGIRFTKE